MDCLEPREVGQTYYFTIDPGEPDVDEPAECAALLRRLADWLDEQQASDRGVLSTVLALSVVHCEGSPLALVAVVE